MDGHLDGEEATLIVYEGKDNSMLADALGTTNLTTTDSGHNVMLYQPQLVADEIMAIVDEVRGR